MTAQKLREEQDELLSLNTSHRGPGPKNRGVSFTRHINTDSKQSFNRRYFTKNLSVIFVNIRFQLKHDQKVITESDLDSTGKTKYAP